MSWSFIVCLTTSAGSWNECSSSCLSVRSNSPWSIYSRGWSTFWRIFVSSGGFIPKNLLLLQIIWSDYCGSLFSFINTSLCAASEEGGEDVWLPTSLSTIESQLSGQRQSRSFTHIFWLTASSVVWALLTTQTPSQRILDHISGGMDDKYVTTLRKVRDKKPVPEIDFTCK